MVLYKTKIKDTYRGDLSTLLTGSIESDRYFPEDIFDVEYSSIYGKWFVYSVYGGFGGGEQRPHFDFLELKRNGIYGVVNDYNLNEYGSFYIESILNDGRIVLNFMPDKSATDWYNINKRLTFLGNDTIIFQDYGCLDCYEYSFVRK